MGIAIEYAQEQSLKELLTGRLSFLQVLPACRGDLNNLTGTYDNIVICDIAIDERTYPQLKEKLNELAEVSNIFYIDHHPLPVRKYSADWFYHDEYSTAEMAYALFSRKLNRDMRRVAIYGAIGEQKPP